MNSSRLLKIWILIANLVRGAVLAKDTKLKLKESLTEPNAPDGKVFSLFSIVTFKNAGCSSSDGTTGTSGINRNGTCYTNTECRDKSGTASGNCAAGFGVCCLFVVTTGGTEITENCTYLQNPNFPSTYSSTSALTYTVNKCMPTICDFRFDFEMFQTWGPSVTTETNGGACSDSFVISSTVTGLSSPVICGSNAGQHIYLDVSTTSTATATVAFTFSATTFTTRRWEIKVTQIPCASNYGPPPGCLQYHTGTTGRLWTFNFAESTTPQHLASQDYAICIRQESNYCCVRYTLCSDANSYTLDGKAVEDDVANTDSNCVEDFLGIQGVASDCDQGSGAILHTKLCGEKFSAVHKGDMDQSSICDCTTPFVVNVKTDATNDGAGDVVQRGVCFNYQMISCNSP